MNEPFARITIGHLVIACYWSDNLKQAEVYDTHAGARGGNQFEHIDTIPVKRYEGFEPHIFHLIQAVVVYAELLDLTIEEIAI